MYSILLVSGPWLIGAAARVQAMEEGEESSSPRPPLLKTQLLLCRLHRPGISASLFSSLFLFSLRNMSWSIFLLPLTALAGTTGELSGIKIELLSFTLMESPFVV